MLVLLFLAVVVAIAIGCAWVSECSAHAQTKEQAFEDAEASTQKIESLLDQIQARLNAEQALAELKKSYGDSLQRRKDDHAAYEAQLDYWRTKYRNAVYVAGNAEKALAGLREMAAAAPLE